MKEPEMVEAMDCSYGVSGENSAWSQPIVTPWVERCPIQAILDTGCSQPLVQVDLVPQQVTRKFFPVRMAGIHGEAEQFKRWWLCLRVMEHQGKLQVGVAPRLACEMVLG